jgi:Glycosyltransferase family 87
MEHRLFTLAQARWMRWLLIVAIVALYAGWTGYVISRDKPIDFYLYYLAAYGFAHGYDVYGNVSWAQLAQQTHVPDFAPPYRYPPLTAQLVLPLTLLQPRLAALIWLIGTAIVFVLSAWLLGRSTQAKWGVTLGLAMLLFFVPPLTTMHAGQVNGFVLLALAVALYAFARRDPAWTGIGVAVGAMLKLIPIAHLAYLGWRRQWRAMLTGLIALVLLFSLAVLLIGWAGLESYARHFLSLGEAGGVFPTGVSQSIYSFLGHLLIPSSNAESLASATQWVQVLGLSTSLVLVLATVALCWPGGDLAQLFDLEFALVTTVINLVTPYAWYHQLVLLLIPFFVLAKRALRMPSLRWMLIPLTVGYMLTDLHGLIWHHLEPWPLLASTPFYTMLMLWGLLAWLIVREKVKRVAA